MVFVAVVLLCFGTHAPCRAQGLTPGDLNQDQNITSVDAAVVPQILAGIHPATALYKNGPLKVRHQSECRWPYCSKLTFSRARDAAGWGGLAAAA